MSARVLLLCALVGNLAAACVSGPDPRPAAPDGPVELRLPRFRGGQWDLATERGNVVLLNYFATWCMPCVAEWPLLVELQNRYRAAGLRVVGVCMDTGADSDEVLGAYLGHFDETNFPIVRATERTFGGAPWPIVQLPTTVIVDRAGNAIGKWEGMLPAQETEALVRDLVLAQPAR